MKSLLPGLLLLSACMFAQDPLQTNTAASLTNLNPSFTGSNGLFRFQTNSRFQWINLSGSYKTYFAGFDTYVKSMMGGIGLNYTRDDQSNGTLVTDRIDLNYAQHIGLFNNKVKLIPSFQVSVFQKTLDYSKMSFGEFEAIRRGWVYSFAPNYEGIVVKRNLDFSSGLIVNYKHLYVGTTMYHITQPDQGLLGPSKLPFRSSSFISYNLPLGDKFLLNGLYRFEKQSSFAYHQLNINALLFRYATVGVGVRSHNIMSTSVGFRYHYFTIAGVYEFGIPKNATGPNTNPSYEISASFNLRNKENRKVITDFERW